MESARARRGGKRVLRGSELRLLSTLEARMPRQNGLAEQIAHRSAAKGVVTAAAAVFRGIVAHVAALA